MQEKIPVLTACHYSTLDAITDECEITHQHHLTEMPGAAYPISSSSAVSTTDIRFQQLLKVVRCHAHILLNADKQVDICYRV